MNMKVFIDDILNEKGEVKEKLYIESDERQFIIKGYTGKVNTDKNGKETEFYNTYGYYPSFEHCISKVVTMKIKESTATNLKELRDDVQRINDFVRAQFQTAAYRD